MTDPASACRCVFAPSIAYIDPACQRIHDTFELEPLLVKQPRGD